MGKTALLQRYCHGTASSPEGTVGANLFVKSLRYKGCKYYIEFVDVSGHSRYSLSRSVFYNSLNAILAVYDVTNANSMKHVKTWIKEVTDAAKSNSDVVDTAFSPRMHGQEQGKGKGKGGGKGLSVMAVGTKVDLLGAKGAEGKGDFSKGVDHHTILVSDKAASKLLLGYSTASCSSTAD